jgi:predicted ATPase
VLNPLSPDESRRLVQHLLRRLPILPNALQEVIVNGAEGNPFYVGELIKMLIEQQVIQPGLETWQVTMDRLATVSVPATLAGVIQARLDGLPADEHAVLQQASVIGRIFGTRRSPRSLDQI